MLAIRGLFLLVGAILGVFYPFVPAILAARGLGPEEIGLTTALAALAFTIAVPLWGHLADVVIGRVLALRVAVIGSTVAVLGLLLDVPAVAVAVLIVVYAGFESALAPLADALAVNAIAGAPRSYARVRLLTSAGFAGTSVLAGRLYDDSGFGPASVLWALVGAAILVSTKWVPDVARYRLGTQMGGEHGAVGGASATAAGRAVEVAGGTGGTAGRVRGGLGTQMGGEHGAVGGAAATAAGSAVEVAGGRVEGPPEGVTARIPGERAGRARGGSFAIVLQTQPRLRGVLLGLGLVHVGMLAGFTFLALRLLQLGGGASDVALSADVSAIAEIPAMAIIPRIVRRTGIRALLVSGIMLYGLVMISWAFLADPTLIIATRVLSGVAFSAITIAAVMTVAALLPPELQGTGQGLYQTVGFGVAAVVANLVGGLVFGSGGAMPLFLGTAVLAGIGSIVAWRTVPVGAQAGRLRSRP